MKKALALARKGEGQVSKNPMVGCVITKNGRVVAEGWHKKFGRPHAEIVALKKIKNPASLRDAVMYVNLEPCVHFGKTPPCALKIVSSRLRRVIIGMKDPNPVVFGKGISVLKKAGMKVDVGCLEKECLGLNKVFLKNMKTGLPFVALKVAMSLDGKIATRTGKSKWITSEVSRNFVKKLRNDFDAIVVGKNTVLRDDPFLSGSKREPIRIVLDSSFETPLSAKVFRDHRAILVTTSKASRSKLQHLKKKNISIKIFPKKIQLTLLVHWLFRKQSIASILVEGGSEVFGSFFDEKLIDKVYFFIAPLIIGGKEAKPAVGGKGTDSLRRALRLTGWKLQGFGSDFLVTGNIKTGP